MAYTLSALLPRKQALVGTVFVALVMGAFINGLDPSLRQTRGTFLQVGPALLPFPVACSKVSATSWPGLQRLSYYLGLQHSPYCLELSHSSCCLAGACHCRLTCQ